MSATTHLLRQIPSPAPTVVLVGGVFPMDLINQLFQEGLLPFHLILLLSIWFSSKISLSHQPMLKQFALLILLQDGQQMQARYSQGVRWPSHQEGLHPETILKFAGSFSFTYTCIQSRSVTRCLFSKRSLNYSYKGKLCFKTYESCICAEVALSPGNLQARL